MGKLDMSDVVFGRKVEKSEDIKSVINCEGT